MLAIQLALCVALASNVASASSMLYFHETFDDRWEERWVHSSSALYGGRAVVAAAPHWENNGLQLPAANQHYGIAAAVSEPIMLNQGLVLQYELPEAAELQAVLATSRLAPRQPLLHHVWPRQMWARQGQWVTSRWQVSCCPQLMTTGQPLAANAVLTQMCKDIAQWPLPELSGTNARGLQ
ncbi:uncharacterized protein HaLaN_15476 [Haematococcus lacustris]|uniref:Uncharacterized protein n=1 Tax=Haematococcus lacustris TaxID=44745 RepID=A0A699ZJ46_HAELA|nr:uncharacterized protein HaLaN_15476 [Haematococcus lacustris]